MTVPDHTDPQATARASAVLPVLLHARPAAVLARAAAAHDARVTLDGADATSVLALMRLGVAAGEEVEVAAEGPDARAAVAAVVRLLAAGLGDPPGERHEP